MELSNSSEVYVGRDVGGRTYEVGSELIDVYVAGTGDNNSWYRGNSPLRCALAPALIFHSEQFKLRSWYLPNIRGNLHTRFECDILAPLPVGARVRTRGFVADRYIKRNREYVVNETLVFDAEDRIVFRSRSYQSFLLPEQARDASQFAVDKARERVPGRVFKTGERGGEPIEAPVRQITDDMCMAFSGPHRNYHTDREEAIKLGFPDLVVQGMLSVCLIGEMMTRHFGLGFFHGGRLNVKLVNILWGNETTGARGLIFERRSEGAHTRAEVEVWCEKSDGTKTVAGSASALVPDSP